MSFLATYSRGDQLVEAAADRLQRLADEFAADGGTRAKLADELAQDAAFIRKLKPSLMAARFRGEASTHQPPGSNARPPQPRAVPQPKAKHNRSGPNPFVVVGAAVVAGVVLSKVIDWRGRGRSRH
jgi:hypothetical protein